MGRVAEQRCRRNRTTASRADEVVGNTTEARLMLQLSAEQFRFDSFTSGEPEGRKCQHLYTRTLQGSQLRTIRSSLTIRVGGSDRVRLGVASLLWLEEMTPDCCGQSTRIQGDGAIGTFVANSWKRIRHASELPPRHRLISVQVLKGTWTDG